MKLFPAAVVGGPRMIAALSGPFPSVRFVPTGGIGPADLVDYLRLPAVLAVGGTWLAPPDVVESGDFAQVARDTRAATAVVEELAEQRGDNGWSNLNDPRAPRFRGVRLRRGLPGRGDAAPGSRRGPDPHGAGVPGLGGRR